MEIKSTEREIVGWIAGVINSIFNKGGYPFEIATTESLIKDESSLFPDLIIWKRRDINNAFTFFEFKKPNQYENLETLKQKAIKLNVKYVFTWNFQECIFYEIDNFELIRKENYPTYTLEKLEEWKLGEKQEKIKENILFFLNIITELFNKGNLYYFVPDKFVFVNILRKTINEIFIPFSKYIKVKYQEKENKDEIDSWVRKQGITNIGDEKFFETLSKQWAYSLITKIIFYLTLKKYFDKLPDLIIKSNRGVDEILKECFNEAKNIDWYSVFEESIIEKLGIPEEAEDSLINLLNTLEKYNFSVLKEDVIGEIFESLIPFEERHNLGQYFTREDLVDLIISFVVNSPEGYFADPTCGSGTFLTRLYHRLKYLSGFKLSHNELLSKIWGIDIANFPSELATINLFRQNIREYENFPRVIVKDFFEVNPLDEFEFPPPKISNFKLKIKEQIPKFNGLVGNFPYIRQELIEEKNKGYKSFLNKVIVNDWIFNYPEGFDEKKNLKLSEQSDIYAYLFFHAGKFLNEGKRMGFLSSFSYLNDLFGYELKKYFLNNYKIICIAVSFTEPWFEDPSVIPIFTILERCEDIKERRNNIVKFIKIKKKFEELIPYRDLKFQDSERWSYLDGLVRKIENIGSEYIKFDKNSIYVSLDGIKTFEDENFRIRLIKQNDLLNEVEDKKEKAKWSKYLIAPDVYFEILEQCKGKLIYFNNIANVKRGYTTGINDFFYLELYEEPTNGNEILKVKNKKGWLGEIEKEFLVPVIKSFKEIKNYETLLIKPKYLAFFCNLSKSELKKLRKFGALSYIEWGEKQRSKNGILWPDVPSVKSFKNWYSLPDMSPGDFIFNSMIGERFGISLNTNRDLVDKRMYQIYLKENSDYELFGALFNSYIFRLFLEMEGRILVGDITGIDIDVYSLENTLILNPELISNEDKKELKKLFNKIKKREIKSIFEEIKMEDRKKLDSLILKSLGLEPKIYLNKIYKSLTELINERIEFSKMRKSKKVEKRTVSIEKIKNILKKEILFKGIREFPESFIENKYLKNAEEIATTGKSLHIGREFFNNFVIEDEDGNYIYEVNNLNIAKFLIYSYKPNKNIIRIPKDPIVISKAVQDYEIYIRELKARLFNRSLEATNDYKLSEKITDEIFIEYGLPKINI